MASVAESIGLGATVHVNDGSSSAYVLIDNLVDFEPPSRKLGTTDSKRLDDGGTDVRVPTRFSPGESKVTCQFGQAGFARMVGLRDNKTKKLWKWTVPDDTSTTVVIVNGYATEVKPSKIESDKITEYEITVTFTGTQS